MQRPTLAHLAELLTTSVIKISSVCKTNKIGCHDCPLKDQKTNFKLIIYSHSSTNPANLANIGLVDCEVIGVTLHTHTPV